MSIRLVDNTLLPDIPAGYEDYPYRLVFAYVMAEDAMYGLVLSKNEPCFVPSALSGDTNNLLHVPAGGKVEFTLLDISQGWGNGSTSDGKSNVTLASTQNITIRVEWSDFDIKYASAVGDDGVPVIGTEVYFEKGVRDATPWPDVSEELLGDTPYAAIVSMGGQYALFSASAPGFVSPFEDDEAQFCIPAGAIKMYVWAEGLTEWMLNQEMTLPATEVMGPVSQLPLSWSNYDILYATSKNDDGTYVIGTDVYFARNDFEVTYAEEYRVETEWLRSIGDEIRRLMESKSNVTTDNMKDALGRMADGAIRSCSMMGAYDPEVSYLGFYSTSETIPEIPGCIQRLIKKLELPNVKTIYSDLNRGTYDTDYTDLRLNELILNSCTNIGPSAFAGQPLTKIIAPMITRLDRAFALCDSLTEITRDFFPEVTETVYQCFTGCSKLVRADFQKVATLGTATFASCYNLKALVLRKTDGICVKNGSGYWDTKITDGKGVVIVPTALLSDYVAGWENQVGANQFIAIEDYSVDGTLDGDIDWDRVDAYIATL